MDSGKEILMTRLNTVDEGPGYCHFPINADRGYNETYIKGLNSEQRVVHIKDGRPVIKWVKKAGGIRNEPLDLRNYSTAAVEILRPDWDLSLIQIYDEGGEYAENYLDDVTKEQREELEEQLDCVFKAGLEKYGLYPNFDTIPSYETYKYIDGKFEREEE